MHPGLFLIISLFLTVSGQGWQKPGCHKVGHTRTIRIDNCVEFPVTTNACRGFCESWSFPNISPETSKRHPVTSLGRCCNIMESEDIKVQVLCLDGPKTVVFKSAVTCSCFHCKKD